MSRDGLRLLKEALPLLPTGEKRDEAERQIAAAEEALRRSDAKLAQDLGYTLCQCTFPPQIMLSQGHDPEHGIELFKCPKCSKQEPSEHKMRQHDRLKANNTGRRQYGRQTL
jgi:hypothetical protein